MTTINTGRVTVFLFLPIALLGLGFLAVGWVRRGFHPVSGEQATLVSTPPPAVMPTIEVKSTEPDLYARQWLRKLTVRWARNGAIAGLATSLLFIVPMLQSPGPGTNSAIGAILVTFVGLSLLAGLVLGFLAKVAIEPHLLISAQSALRKITLTWIYVAIAVATIFFVTDFLFQWRSVRPAGGVVAFIGFFGGHALIGYLISLVSKWGLRLAIEKDKRATAMMS